MTIPGLIRCKAQTATLVPVPYIPNLSALRLRCGLSQAGLARKAGIDRATVSRCENGYFVMDIKAAAIEIAIREEAGKKNISVSEMKIMPGGKIEEFPKKK